METLHIVLIIGALLMLYYMQANTENLTAKPTDEDKFNMAGLVLNNKELFTNQSSLIQARNRMPWLDAITYEDIRKLIRENNLNRENIVNILS